MSFNWTFLNHKEEIMSRQQTKSKNTMQIWHCVRSLRLEDLDLMDADALFVLSVRQKMTYCLHMIVYSPKPWILRIYTLWINARISECMSLFGPNIPNL